MRKVVVLLGITAIVFLATAPVALAAEAPTAGAKEVTLAHGLLGLAAALAVAFGAMGTAWAQSRIGAAAAGAVAERPEIGGTMLLWLALPETLILFGFVVALQILGKI